MYTPTPKKKEKEGTETATVARSLMCGVRKHNLIAQKLMQGSTPTILIAVVQLQDNNT